MTSYMVDEDKSNFWSVWNSMQFKKFVEGLGLSELNWYLLQKSVALLETVPILWQIFQLSGAGCTQAD